MVRLRNLKDKNKGKGQGAVPRWPKGDLPVTTLKHQKVESVNLCLSLFGSSFLGNNQNFFKKHLLCARPCAWCFMYVACRAHDSLQSRPWLFQPADEDADSEICVPLVPRPPGTWGWARDMSGAIRLPFHPLGSSQLFPGGCFYK